MKNSSLREETRYHPLLGACLARETEKAVLLNTCVDTETKSPKRAEVWVPKKALRNQENIGDDDFQVAGWVIESLESRIEAQHPTWGCVSLRFEEDPAQLRFEEDE